MAKSFMCKKHLYQCVLAILATSVGQYAYAEVEEGDVPTTDFGDLVVTVERKKEPQKNIATVTKTAETIRTEQVNGIRDLTRYDPGIAVNEQGQGASSGYSIRGVDRNRVAVSVDGLAQAQIFSPSGIQGANGSYGGATNEIEYENIKEVSIQKGANSVAAGSGAMGGAVLFVTKEASDVIKDGKDWGIDFKSGYNSKDGRVGNTLAVAGRIGEVDILTQFTHRTGHEIQAHDDAESQTLTSLWQLPPEFDDPNSVVYKEMQDGRFYCTNSASYCRYTQTFAAKDVTGPTREVPNPMEYETKSWLIRPTWHINDNHSLGVIFEHTEQKYNIRDLTYPAVVPHGGTKIDTNRTDGDHYANLSTIFVDNEHTKKRIGLEYRYKPQIAKAYLPDSAKVAVDRQDLTMNNTYRQQRCATHMGLCEPTELGQWYAITKSATQDDNTRIRLDFDKAFETGVAKHQLAMSLGAARSTFTPSEHHVSKRLYDLWPFNVNTQQYEQKLFEESSDDQLALESIRGKHRFISLSDDIALGERFTFPLGVRYDDYAYESDNRFVGNRTYHNTSWNAGVHFMPNRYIELAYRASSGFRVPSALEMYSTGMLYGITSDIVPNLEPVKPETALNQEIALNLHNDFGSIRVSKFWADYKDLLGEVHEKDPAGGLKNARIANIRDAHTTGWDVNVQAELGDMLSFVPEGVRASLSYGVVTPRKAPNDVSGDTYFLNTTYVMETLQPAKFVYGLDYDAPSGDWGVGSRVVRSMAKDAKENERHQAHPLGHTITRQYIPMLSKPWTTLDLTAWYAINDNITVRGGVYNVFDKKYTQWETMRTLGVVGESTASRPSLQGNGVSRLTAPGRNFAVALEMKF